MPDRTSIAIFRTDAVIGRRVFLLIGVVLCIVKFLIDRTVAHMFFDRQWSPFEYLVSGTTLGTLLRIAEDQRFFLTLLAMSVPFVCIGVPLTLARLRSAGLRPWLVVFFFLPVLNLIFFLVLSILPKASSPAQPTQPIPVIPISAGEARLWYGTDAPATGFLAFVFPESAGASVVVSTTITVLLLLAVTWLSIYIFAQYGWGMFVALPFSSGALAAVLHGMRRPRSIGQSIGVAVLATVISVAAILVVGIDGLGCLIMFLPLAIPLAVLGALVGHSMQIGQRRPRGGGRVIWSMILFPPAFMATEKIAQPPSPVFAVVTSVDINAPPARVWPHVISFSPIAPPTDWVFRMGVAYPVRAEIIGHGVGAMRRCVFSTGAFVEPIREWDEPRLLKFDVSTNPPAMHEWSPYAIHPPHIEGFLISHAGQFKLIPLPDGRTRLEGTTWYEHNMWPSNYWRMWSDFILHRIHRRVLEQVKMESER